MQGTGQLMAAMFQGLGGLLGYVLQKFLYTDPVELLWLFVCVFLINLLFVSITSFVVKEEVCTTVQPQSIHVLSHISKRKSDFACVMASCSWSTSCALNTGLPWRVCWLSPRPLHQPVRLDPQDRWPHCPCHDCRVLLVVGSVLLVVCDIALLVVFRRQ
jgi:hypothetical protein